MELFNYLLKVSACSALLFAFYLLVLRKLTFFKINRFYLLTSVLISFIIPAVQVIVEREREEPLPQLVVNSAVVRNHNPTLELMQTPITVESLQIKGTGSLNWITILPFVYGAIVLAILLTTTIKLFSLLKHTKAPIKKINGLKLVVKSTGFTNCSFFNYVFIDEQSLTSTELTVLLAHEEIHAKQFHSIDKLILTIAKAVLWFNPIIYLFDKALEQAHEFEADEAAANHVGSEAYASLLLKLAISKSENPLLHNFVKSPVKQRIKMLLSSKSAKAKKVVYLLVAPVGMLLIWGFTIKVVYASPFVKEKLAVIKENLPSSIVTVPETKLEVKEDNEKVELDTLRLVGSGRLGKNPKVTIDGKSYPSNILTKINPNSIKSTITLPNEITIATKNNKIEYATKIDIYNFREKQSINNNKLYARYSQLRDNGEKYEVLKVNMVNGSLAMDVPARSKVLILIGGVKFSEAEARTFAKTPLRYGVDILERTMPDFAAKYPQYLGKYDAVVNIPENSSEERGSKLLVKDQKVILVIDNATITREQLDDFALKLKEKNFNFHIKEAKYDKDNKLTQVNLYFKYNEDDKDFVTATVTLGQKGRTIFYRIFDKNYFSPIGVTSDSDDEYAYLIQQ